VPQTAPKPWKFWSVPAAPESGKLVLARRLVHTWCHNHLSTRLQTGTQHLCCFAQLCTCCRPGYVVYFLSWTEHKKYVCFVADTTLVGSCLAARQKAHEWPHWKNRTNSERITIQSSSRSSSLRFNRFLSVLCARVRIL